MDNRDFLSKDKEMKHIEQERLLKGLLVFLLSVLCVGCGPLAMDCRIGFNLVNNADYSIGFYIADGGEYGTIYPDSLPETNAYVTYDISNVLRPGFEAHYCSWEKFFKMFPSDTLSVFIFHTDTLNKYSWEEVRDGYKILRRYDFGKEDLENLYELVYP